MFSSGCLSETLMVIAGCGALKKNTVKTLSAKLELSYSKAPRGSVADKLVGYCVLAGVLKDLQDSFTSSESFLSTGFTDTLFELPHS